MFICFCWDLQFPDLRTEKVYPSERFSISEREKLAESDSIFWVTERCKVIPW